MCVCVCILDQCTAPLQGSVGHVEERLFLPVHSAAELTAHAVQWLGYEKENGQLKGGLTHTHTHTHTHRQSQSLQCLSWFNAETKLTADISGVFPRSLTRSLHVSDLKISPKRYPDLSPLLYYSLHLEFNFKLSLYPFHASFTASCSETFQRVHVQETIKEALVTSAFPAATLI